MMVVEVCGCFTFFSQFWMAAVIVLWVLFMCSGWWWLLSCLRLVLYFDWHLCIFGLEGCSIGLVVFLVFCLGLLVEIIRIFCIE